MSDMEYSSEYIKKIVAMLDKQEEKIKLISILK